MDMFRLGFAIAGLFIGAITAFLGIAVTVLALKSGEIGVSLSSAASATMVSRAADPSRYWLDVAIFGLAPALLGMAAAAYAWRRLTSG